MNSKRADNEPKGDFWSRRKAAVQKAEADEEADRQALDNADKAAALEEKSDAKILEELGLPDPDELEDSTDIRAFMAGAVPQRLRQRALRRLWKINPALANLDGLVDYGEDFTDAATVIDDLQTTYQVGKGMMEHVMRLAEQAEASPDETDMAEAQDETAEPAPIESAHCASVDLEQSVENNDPEILTESGFPLQTDDGVSVSGEFFGEIVGDEQAEVIGLSAEEERPPRRRMRFS